MPQMTPFENLLFCTGGNLSISFNVKGNLETIPNWLAYVTRGESRQVSLLILNELNQIVSNPDKEKWLLVKGGA